MYAYISLFNTLQACSLTKQNSMRVKLHMIILSQSEMKSCLYISDDMVKHWTWLINTLK